MMNDRINGFYNVWALKRENFYLMRKGNGKRSFDNENAEIVLRLENFLNWKLSQAI